MRIVDNEFRIALKLGDTDDKGKQTLQSIVNC